jgi:hypothetical protein
MSAAYCRRAKKHRYPTGGLAQSSLLAIQAKGAHTAGHRPTRFYRCSHCDGFHLTSMPKAA